MSNFNNEYSFVPPSIRLLFDNSQLEMIKTLCLLYSFYQKSKRKFVKVSDIVFYYSLVNFGMIKLIEIDGEREEASRNLYYRYEQGINQIILEMVHLDFIEVKGNLTSKASQIGMRLTQKGNEFLNNLELNSFPDLINEYSNIISLIENNPENNNKLKGVIK
ncbi:hypothetical protein OTK50_13420 [Bacillus sp. NEAU-CP5]|uniref:hypothetical protein n=1 Tax=Bacillus TaxID=1386 RepID=UPI0005EB6708|nr:MULTISPECIES: hypothetical protein [Bacillus]KJR67553.1 hypothetical protein BAGR45_19735 [Bacillus velezensis]MCX3306194.1 hypothetical protein [Bacillus velezensis]MCX8440794.1 hypothetical protein [Bacillus sp. NEAU-CP5]ULH20233.1 hypothetical protein MF598_00520 [Bacillus velezensis]WJF81619.1 hypothetical protein QRA13_12825 [Bacillus velezensis]